MAPVAGPRARRRVGVRDGDAGAISVERSARTPIGIKIMGANVDEMQKLGEHLEMTLKNVPERRFERVAEVLAGLGIVVVGMAYKVSFC